MTDQPSISAPVRALQAISVLVQHRPWFETYEKHLEAHRAFDVLFNFIKDELQKEQAAKSAPSANEL